MVSVHRVLTGVYCIALTGVDRSAATYGAGPDFRTSTVTAGLSTVYTDATSAGCEANSRPGEFEVLTFQITGATTASTSNGIGFWFAVY